MCLGVFSVREVKEGLNCWYQFLPVLISSEHYYTRDTKRYIFSEYVNQFDLIPYHEDV